MIKLPLVTPAAEGDGGLIAAAAGKGDKGDKGDKGLSEAFLSLFSKALPGQMAQGDGETLSLSAALKKVTGKDAAADDAGESKATLADLLNGPDAERPEALAALLANSGRGTVQATTAPTEADADGTHRLSAADMQALSALLAMLPQQNPAAPATAQATVAGIDGDAGSVLNAVTGNSAPAVGSDVLAKATPGKAGDGLTAAGGPADGKFAVKTAAPAAQQTTDAPVLPAVAVDKDSRESAISNNTTPTASAAPALSSAIVSTPLSAHIATPAAAQISAQLGSHEWQQAVSQHVTLFTRQGQQSAELRLHPEDLGQIQISLKLDDGQAQLQMSSPHGHVRAALEATLPTLRTALAESGIQLGQSSIGSEAFTQQQSGQQPPSQRQAGTFPSPENDAERVAVPASVQRLAAGSNAVDIFA